MGTRHLLDASGGVVSTIEYADERDISKGFTIVSEQECDGLLREIRLAREVAEAAPERAFRHAAKIPGEVVAQAMREGWFDDPAAWRRWANDRDNQKFRVWEGRV